MHLIRTRRLALTALAALAVVGAALPGRAGASGDPSTTGSVGIAADEVSEQVGLAARAAPPSAGETAELESIISSTINDVGRFWSVKLGRTSFRYALVHPGQTIQTRCDTQPVDAFDGPYYCPADDVVVLGLGYLVEPLRAYGPAAVAVTVAHEVGHNVQWEVYPPAAPSEQRELQADCLAGTWMHDVDVRRTLSAREITDAGLFIHDNGDFAFGDPRHHGTPDQRQGSFFRGLLGYDCFGALGDF